MIVVLFTLNFYSNYGCSSVTQTWEISNITGNSHNDLSPGSNIVTRIFRCSHNTTKSLLFYVLKSSDCVVNV